MAKNVITKARKLHSMHGNLKYLNDKMLHPDICITHSTCEMDLWYEYAAENRRAFEASGKSEDGEHKCVEAREMIYIFPEEFYGLTAQEKAVLLRNMANDFKKAYGVECYVAMHGSDKDCSNLHVHVMYMERTRINKGEKIADRRLYFDDRGRQVKSRKFAVDENGDLLPGYSFVKKGEAYGGDRTWSSKNQYLHSNKFLNETKQWWADKLNHFRENEYADLNVQEERVVYDRENSPFLPQQDVKGYYYYRSTTNPKIVFKIENEPSEEILECAELRREYNELVEEALDSGASLQRLIERRKGVSAEIAAACRSDQKFKIKDILDKAIDKLSQFIESLISKIRGPESPEEDVLPTRKPGLDNMIGSAASKQTEKADSHIQRSRGSRSDDGRGI